jgi:hypothetical protein
MTYPLENIKQLEINSNNVKVTYNDWTTLNINIPNLHITRKDTETGEVTHQHHNSIIFQTDYKNPNNQPIIDHCI